ncbi:MAG: hypothetical protein ACFFAU_00430 [Candidatus Hodarchaeota archaeon]
MRSLLGCYRSFFSPRGYFKMLTEFHVKANIPFTTDFIKEKVKEFQIVFPEPS